MEGAHEGLIEEGRRRLSIFHDQKMDWVLEAMRETHRRWHNQKDPASWIVHQERAAVIDRGILERHQ